MAHLEYGIALRLTAPETGEARRALAHAVALTPGNARAHYHLAEVLRLQHETDAAAQHYRDALRLRPTFRDARYALAMLMARLEQPDAALADAEANDSFAFEPLESTLLG